MGLYGPPLESVMAKKRVRSVRTHAEEQAPVIAKVQLQHNENTATYYVNNVEVSHTPFDFAISWAKIPTKLSTVELETVKSTGNVSLDAMVVLTVPPAVIPGLIRALMIQKEMYEKTVGQIPDPGNIGPSVNEH